MNMEVIVKEGLVIRMESHVKHESWLQVVAFGPNKPGALRCFQYPKVENQPPIVEVELAEDDVIRKEQLDLLPDYARRSRHQENLYPFAILKQQKNNVEEEDEDYEEEVYNGEGNVKDDDGDDAGAPALVVTVDGGTKMWDWAKAIRWLGRNPTEINNQQLPYLYAATTSCVNPHFTNPRTLQELLLKLDYFEVTRRIGEVKWYALVGACVHVAERNVEMLLSTDMYDFSGPMNGRSFTTGNTPLSMVLEGNYSPSRVHIVQTLLARGHPMGRGISGGAGYGLTYLLTKPGRITGTSSIRGKAVHEDDKLLAKHLHSLGESVEYNKVFENELMDFFDDLPEHGFDGVDDKGDAAEDEDEDEDQDEDGDGIDGLDSGNQNKQEGQQQRQPFFGTIDELSNMVGQTHDDAQAELKLKGQHERRKRGNHVVKFSHIGNSQSPGLTRLLIPDSYSHHMARLEVLELSENHLTTLPEELFTLSTNLQVLDISFNCLWELSPSIQKLKKLKILKLHHNLIESLPEEISSIDSLVEMTCDNNPILYPPKAITDHGWSSIKSFFKGILKHGTITNTDLKVLVVGLSEAGKTSLIQAVISGTSNLVRQGDRTVGIEQKSWAFERNTPDPNRVKANDISGLVYESVTNGPTNESRKILFSNERDCLIVPIDFDNHESPISFKLTNAKWDTQSRTYTGTLTPSVTSYTHPMFSYPMGDSHSSMMPRPTQPWVECTIKVSEDYEEATVEFSGVRAPKAPVLKREVEASNPNALVEDTLPLLVNANGVREDGVYAVINTLSRRSEYYHLLVNFNNVTWDYKVYSERNRHVPGLNSVDYILGTDVLGKFKHIKDVISHLHQSAAATAGVGLRVSKKQEFTRNVPTLPNVNLLLYDFAGQQEYYITHHIFLTERALYVLAFDLSKYSSATFHDQVQFWVTSIQERVPGAKVLLVGTHADKLPLDTCEKYCEKVRMTLKNKRKRTEKRLDKKTNEAQIVVKKYQKLRQAFAERKVSALFHISDLKIREMNRKALAGMVMSEIEADILETYHELYSSKEALTPQMVADEMQTQRSIARWDYQLKNLAPTPRVLAVSSAEGLQGMNEFTETMKAEVQDRVHFPELDEKIPTYYNKVRRLIRAVRNDPAKLYMKSDDYIAMFSTELGLTPAEVDEATAFMHVIGEVLYYNKTKRADGLDVIFLKVSFLVDAFKFVVRHDHADATIYRDSKSVDGDSSTANHIEYDTQIDEAEFNRLKVLLLEKGELHLPLLERLWANEAPNGIGISKTKQPQKFWNLVELLSKFQIASVLRHDENSQPSVFIVPEFAPTRLPRDGWSWNATENSDYIQRYFDFGTTPPSGMIQRLQVKLCPFVDSDRPFVIAREGATFAIKGFDVFMHQLQGKNPNRPHGEGLQLIVRGQTSTAQDATRFWKTMRLLIYEVEQLFDEWPGLMCDQFVIDNKQDAFVALETLISQRDSGLESENLDRLLGPKDVNMWSLEEFAIVKLENVIAISETLAANSNVKGETPNVVGDVRFQNVVALYREQLIPWAMLLHSDQTKALAERVFVRLTEKGIPAWLSRYSGAHGTQSDQLRDGLSKATVVVPILDSDSTNSANNDGDTLDTSISTTLSNATKAGIPIVVVDARSSSGPDMVRGCTEVVRVADASDSNRDWISEAMVASLIESITKPGRVKRLQTPFTGNESNHVRRKSFSKQQKSVHDVGGNVNVDANVNAPNTILNTANDGDAVEINKQEHHHQLSAESASSTNTNTNTDTNADSVTLYRILHFEIGFPDHIAQSYVHSLEQVFRESFGNDNVENILLCDADVLSMAVLQLFHRTRIIMWIEQRKACKLNAF